MTFLQLRVVVLFILGTSFISCSETIKERDGVLGKEATAEERQNAINEALAGISINNAKMHSKVSYIENVRVELNPVMTIRSYNLELNSVVNVDKDKHIATYEIKQTITPYENEIPGEPTTSGFTVDEPYFPSSSIAQLESKIFAAANSACDGVDETDSDGITYDCVKFFNLKHEKRLVPAPQDIANKDNCMNFANCLIPVDLLQYDYVLWSKGKAVLKFTLSYEIARDIPDIFYTEEGNSKTYTPPVTSFCIKGTQTYKGQSYAVSRCKVLRNFDIPSGN